MIRTNKITSILFLILTIAIFTSLPWSEVIAQCPMCKVAAESNLQNGGTAGRGLNAGIFYMLSMPYVIVATLAILWVRKKRKTAKENQFDFSMN